MKILFLKGRKYDDQKKSPRTPFHYQVSEEDCFPTSVINALIYLYKRSEIPAEVIRMVYLLSLDDPKNEMSTKKGTKALIAWLKEYSKNKEGRKIPFSIDAEILEGKDINLRSKKISKCLNKNGVVLCDIWHLKKPMMSHTILAFKHDSEWIYFWDPYRVIIPEECKKYVESRADKKEDYNLRIKKKWLDKDNHKKYTFYKDGYCVLLWKI